MAVACTNSRKPGFGSTIPKFPTIGSIKIAAISSPHLFIASVKASGLLKGTVITSSAVEVVTPAESGVPNVAGPEPAATNTKSK